MIQSSYLPPFATIALVACLHCPVTTFGDERTPANLPADPAHAQPGQATASTSLALVKDGVANSVIVLTKAADPAVRPIVDDFIRTVKRSTGATLKVVEASRAANLPGEIVRLDLTNPQPTDAEPLADETYRITTNENVVSIRWKEEPHPLSPERAKAGSRPLRWALNRILEEQLGVRWLWPGELGTYVPKHRNLAVPVQEVTYQPDLNIRSLRITMNYARRGIEDPFLRKIEQEALDWAENHQVGRRGNVRFGHAFSHWWEKYGATHPEYFAEPLPGMSQPVSKPGYIKLRLSNPAILDVMVKEYEAAGAPDDWPICPNDGSGFDVSEATRAWDLPRDQPMEQIWKARGNLTARYVHFWNLLYERLKQINPRVVLATYAYSSYKTPPPRERPLTARMNIALVLNYDSYHIWKGWAGENTALYFRPNWWHYGANGPYLPLDEASRFLKFAWANGLKGMDMDSVLGYWGTQGPNYYLVARLMTRPGLSKETILEEYTSAFGAGAPKIREYLDYWQKQATEFRYGSPDGTVQALIDSGKIDRSLTRGSRQALPFLFPEESLLPACRLLDEADRLIGDSDPEARQRVAFIRDGINELRATRDLVAFSRSANKKSNDDLAEFGRRSDQLEQLRHDLSHRHVIWGEYISRAEDRRHVYIRPRVSKPTEELTGEM